MGLMDKVYVAGLGMVTPLGGDVTTTAAAINAGISAYGSSDIYDQNLNPVTAAFVNDGALAKLEYEIDEGPYYGGQHDHAIKLGLMAVYQALATANDSAPVPAVLAFSTPESEQQHSYSQSFVHNLKKQDDLPIDRDAIYSIHSGRAGGIEAIDLGMRCLADTNAENVLIGGVDSFYHAPRLSLLAEEGRLLSSGNSDGFAPGEGAAFLLLTKDRNKAMVKNGRLFLLHPPGLGQEPGHINADSPCLGDGLDQAVKLAMSGYGGPPLTMIYSSMNGERYWSKELGAVMIRNGEVLSENIEVKHPLDCLGDPGSSCGPILAGLAIDMLAKSSTHSNVLLYASSDGESRAALRIEKIEVKSDIRERQYV